MYARSDEEYEEFARKCQRYRALFEGMRDIVLMVDPDDYRLVDANKTAVKTYGYSLHELRGMNLRDLLTPRAIMGLSRHMEEILTRGAIFRSIHKRKDGATLPVEVSATAATIDNEQVVIATVRDISQRREMEFDLARLSTVVEHSPDAIWATDLEGKITHWNPGAQRLYGYSLPWVLGQPASMLMPRDGDAQDLSRVLGLIKKGKQVPPYETKALTHDGRVVDVSVTVAVIKSQAEQLIGISWIAHDISAFKRIQAECPHAEVEATISAIGEGVVIYGPEAQVVRINRAAERILGVKVNQLQGRSLAQRLREFGAKTLEGKPIALASMPVNRALHGEPVEGYRLVINRPDGEERFLLASAAPIHDPGGQIAGAIVTFTDITELVELIRLRDVVISTVAHDIRQPLTIIQGQSQLVARALDKGSTEQARKSIDAVITSARRMNVMIQDLVDSVRLEAGRLELSQRSLDIGKYLSELLQRSRAAYDVSRVHLTVAEGLPPVSADPDRLERVVLNLLSNALKYSDPGTPVDIRVTQRDNEAVIAVQDRGPGILPEDKPHLFQRFYRAKGAHEKDSLGLGLYISRVLVSAHGGRIWVESQPGQGSTFYFTLPLASGE